MDAITLLRLGIVLGGAALIGAGRLPVAPRLRLAQLSGGALGLLAVANIAFAIAVFANHLTFPFALEIMEGSVLEHMRRAMAFEPIYPAPSAAFVSFAYNPLYYYASIPATALFGTTLTAMRFTSLVAIVVCAWVLFRLSTRKLDSAWWGIVTVGLFAAAYRVMDAYLDTAHSDACFLAATLLGVELLDRNRSRAASICGIALLVTAFWFKQHGAIFTVGGLCFLTWRDGWRFALPGWIFALVFGAGAYWLVGPLLFGSHFHYFTWEVPSGWSEFNLSAMRRTLSFIILKYPVLAGAAAAALAIELVRIARHRRAESAPVDAYVFLLPFAVLSGLMGALDPGSSYNVFIPMGTWWIIVGIIGLHRVCRRVPALAAWRADHLALFVSFAVFLYHPASVWTSSNAREKYSDLMDVFRELDGPVYLPTTGQLPSDLHLPVAAHWVALEDLVRGPGKHVDYDPRVRELLAPVLSTTRPQYVMTHMPLGSGMDSLRFLADFYVPMKDYRDDFRALAPLRHRWDLYWPRFLYRLDPSAAR